MRSLQKRNQEWDAASRNLFDVAIIGGGVNGACLYHQLCENGFRVLLLDRGDFGSGTSQASAMMIWGGLLYLRNFDFATVLKLCLSRERMIGQMKNCVQPQIFRYVSNRNSHNATLVTMALYFYWMMGGFRRSLPHTIRCFPELAFLDSAKFQNALDYEEGRVLPSDARFVLSWILAHRNEQQIALNYCGVVNGDYDTTAGHWNLNFNDSVLHKEGIIRAKIAINAAGVWTDSVNQTFGIDSPYKHVFSKGVFLAIPRKREHVTPLILDMGRQSDYMSMIPWGPVSLWGPTETTVRDITEGFRPTSEDVSYLLAELNQNLAHPVMPSEIVSLRCGVRPLAVKSSYNKDCYPLDLSRKSQVVFDSDKSWISVYGGKLTGCIPLAESITKLISERISAKRIQNHLEIPKPELIAFPGLEEKVPSPAWCSEHEICWTLEDYLRRRTNISQWIPRGGLGRDDGNLSEIESISRIFSTDSKMLCDYRKKIQSEFDEIVPRTSRTPWRARGPRYEETK
jgi:glycerol-3-phosphate dehydrogenase